MAIVATDMQRAGDGASSIATLAASDGCARHPWVAQLTHPAAPGRDLADAVHALCAVHGRHADLFEKAGYRAVPDLDQRWLEPAAGGFARERAYIAALTAAVGPLPSTAGQAESDAAFAAMRHAFDMLASSERTGCATGAAVALLIDWQAFRAILDAAADRFSVDTPDPALPDEVEIVRIAAAAGATPAILRAMRFGAQQAFAQHRGLLDLLEARAIARNHH